MTTADPNDPGPVPDEVDPFYAETDHDGAGDVVDLDDPAEVDPETDVMLPHRPGLDPEAGPQDGEADECAR